MNVGSRIMHLIISNEIANQLPIANKQAFLLGGIAPDAVLNKEISHFYVGHHHDYSRSIAYETFYEKYRDRKETDYILGYYTHLITDDIWLQGFSLPWLRNRLKKDEDLFNRYHHDFRLLNGKLLSYYGITTDILKGVNNVDSVPDLAEVTANDVEKLLPSVKKDMNDNEQDVDEQLSVFTFEQIIGYIETSIEKSLFLLNKIDSKLKSDIVIKGS